MPACVVAPELTEGPYYLDVNLKRSDIRANSGDSKPVDGATLTLDWIVSQADGSACMPMDGVVVDVWHCDALGVYSGVQGSGGDFLRGFQRTDANGRASFTTVYPGWYQGRAPRAATGRRVFAPGATFRSVRPFGRDWASRFAPRATFRSVPALRPRLGVAFSSRRRRRSGARSGNGTEGRVFGP